MSVLLLTSRYEGLPIVFLEAMLQGVPVVSTRVGGVSECVTEDVGILVDSGASASSIADEVLELLNRIEEDPDIRSRCRARIQESFSLERMQSAYVRKFEALCAGRNIVRRLSDYELWAMTNPNSWQ
jgi:glycosyltransferase involved in cell wall biosynthesis